jgi:RNA polymerase sigma factor (sigma-70 family)
MDRRDWLAGQFEQQRPYLRAVAYRMLGSLSAAEDAVQECWIRLDRSDSDQLVDLRQWLTTVVSRICLDMLRSRRAHREQPVGTWLPEPVLSEEPNPGPEDHAVLADSVGIALLVVLETLAPAERLAFVLHDVFAVPFEEIAQIVRRTPQSARQLASRARRRVRHAPTPDSDLTSQRRVVDAFLAAARDGDFQKLLTVLDPEVVFRVDVGGGHAGLVVHGAPAVAKQVLAAAPRFAHLASPVVVNGAAGALFGSQDKPVSVAGFTVVNARIVTIDIIADPEKLRRLSIVP